MTPLKFISVTAGLFALCLCFTTAALSQQMPMTSGMPAGNFSSATSPSALYINPANIAVPHYRYRHQIQLGGISAGINRGYATDEVTDQIDSFHQDWFTINPDRQPLHSEDIPEGTASQLHHTYYDALLAGFTRRTSGFSWGIGLRSRSYNAAYQNSGWFDNSEALNERLLRQRITTLHEINVGIAGPVEMASGWRSGLSTLFFGVSPKFVTTGLHFDGNYRSIHAQDVEGWQRERTLQVRSTGDVSRATELYREGAQMDEAYSMSFTEESLMQPTGMGGGIDVGLTWIAALGDDMALAPGSNSGLSHNFRLHLAVTDIGAVRYTDDFYNYSSVSTTDQTEAPSASTSGFSGKPGAFHQFITSHEEERQAYNHLEQTEAREWIQLPTAVSVAAAYQYQNWMVRADGHYQLNPMHFFRRGWYTRLASEFTLLKILPVRTAVHLDPELTPAIEFGTGLDFGVIDLNVDTRLGENPEGEWLVQEIATGTLSVRF